MATVFSDRTDRATTEHRGPAPQYMSGDPSVGDLIGDIGKDVSQLVHDEIELAKAEIKQESAKAGKAAGMLAGAGYAGHLVIVIGSFAAVFGLAHVVGLAWAALIVTAVWAIAGALLYVVGRKQLRTAKLKPEQTVDTLKEDAVWARNPTS